jgi:MFS family permease
MRTTIGRPTREQLEEPDSEGVIETDVPARLDRLPWSRWHWLVLVGLGTVWILDGLEVTIVGAIGSTITKSHSGITITTAQIGDAAGIYIAGACLGALLFGHLTDRFGRKRLFLVTLGLYLTATLLTASSFDAWWFFGFRFLTGMGIGGEYSAINSAIDELIPARVRGTVDLLVNGSYWVGTAVGAAASLVLLDPHVLAVDIGWRLCFGIGAVLGVAIIIVRRLVPESPRWLFTHGRPEEASEIVLDIENQVAKSTGQRLDEVTETVKVRERGPVGFIEVGRIVFGEYPRRSILGLALFTGQAFLYNAVFFTYALVLTTFYKVNAASVGLYLIAFAIGNFAGPLLLGRLFDTIGRRWMIAGTYLLSGLMLGVTAALFNAGILSATTQTVAWVVVFFFASAGASAAYLTVSEIFPMETRALAIAFFYAIGTGLGGVIGPVLFGALIASDKVSHVAIGYVIGGGLMFASGLVEVFLGVDAEQMSLEEIAAPVSAAEGSESTGEAGKKSVPAQTSVRSRRTRPPLAAVERARLPRALWAPVPQASSFPRDDPYRGDEVERIVTAVREAPGAVSFAEIAARTGGRYWGPSRLRSAVRGAVYSGRVRPVGRDMYVLADLRGRKQTVGSGRDASANR